MNSDKYYTSQDVVQHLVTALMQYLDSRPIADIIEPSAGDGAFIEALQSAFPESDHHYIDILPEHRLVKEGDWLHWSKGKVFGSCVIVGNPPFGKNASLAVDFFNKAASHLPLAIAFVLPKTFMKQRFWKRLDKGYSLHWQEGCNKNSFLVDGAAYDVPCVMQIWIPKKRKDTLPEKLELFEEVPPENASCFIRRAGGKAGQPVANYTPSSTYSVKCSDLTFCCLQRYAEEIKQQASKTVGVRSITLLEIEDIILGRI